LLDLVRLAEQVTGRSIPVTLHPGRGIDVDAIWLDSSRLHAATGWRATTSLADGVARTWDALAH
jgi:nucleoside-diphosphate-sugar epimerase